MTLLSRLALASKAFRDAPSIEKFEQALNGQQQQLEEKSMRENSRLDIHSSKSDLAYVSAFKMLRGWVKRSEGIPPYGSYERDVFMSRYWMDEPILAGAVYSLVAKFTALKWNVTGRKNLAQQSARLLSRAAHVGGYDWGGFISATASDFYTTSNGVFWELAKSGDPITSVMEDIGTIDSLACTLTGNSVYPMVYMSNVTGQTLKFKYGEYSHFASLPSAREDYLGIGFCFVDRCYRAAKLLMGLHDYDDEKLNNLPPEGIAAVTGLTMDELSDAFALYKAGRSRDKSLTYPQVLWLVSSQPNAGVDVKFQGFSQIPESFDRKAVIDQYAQIVALTAGVDVREFWSIATGGGLGTAGESEVQHMKAKGKGPGEFISVVERNINGELPDGVDYGFDTQDVEEDANAAAVAKAWIDAYFPLYNLPPEEKGKGSGNNPVAKANPQPDKPNGQPNNPTTPIPGVDVGRGMTNSGQQPNQPKNASQVITKDQLLRLLADKGVIPDWMVTDDRVMVQDTEIHLDKSWGDDVVKYEWQPS